MIKQITMMFLIGHLVGDYYLQTDRMADHKEWSFKVLFGHGLVYMISMVLATLPFFSIELLYIALAISGVHFIIDLIKYLILVDERYSTKLFIIDQLLHILTIIVAVLMIGYLNIPTSYHPIMYQYDEMFINIAMKYILLVLFIMKPTSVIIRQVLNRYTPTLEREDEGFKNAGSLIGILERLLIMVLLFANQYVVIGFVLTAKSITRYDKITKNPQFSEYYLLGTLLSILLVVIAFFLATFPGIV